MVTPPAGEIRVAAAPPVEATAQELIAAPPVPDPVPADLPHPEPALPHVQSTPAPVVASPARTGEGVEAAIGGRLLLYAGALTVILGVAFFLKYAFDRNWITEWMRVAIGILSGIGFVALGLRLARAGYRGYGQILSGVGLAALYLSVYAAFSFYDLIGRTAAFALVARCHGGRGLAVGSPGVAGHGRDGRRRRIPHAISRGRRLGRADHVVLVCGVADCRHALARPAARLAAAPGNGIRIHADDRRRVGSRLLHALQVPANDAPADNVLRTVHPRALGRGGIHDRERAVCQFDSRVGSGALSHRHRRAAVQPRRGAPRLSDCGEPRRRRMGDAHRASGPSPGHVGRRAAAAHRLGVGSSDPRVDPSRTGHHRRRLSDPPGRAVRPFDSTRHEARMAGPRPGPRQRSRRLPGRVRPARAHIPRLGSLRRPGAGGASRRRGTADTPS